MRLNYSKAWAGLVALVLVAGTGGMAAAQGKGNGGGGGGGGGGGNAGDAAGALYGDLYVIERDGAGEPITRPVSYPDAETGATVTVDCVQPLAVGCGKLPLWGECGTDYPEGVLKPSVACTFDPELNDACAVYANADGVTDQFTDMIQEVKFGRESVSRAPAAVLDKSYAEALKSINSATANQCACEAGDCTETDPRAIKLDPAGRLTLCLATETEPVSYAWKTIDAPLENLGLYRAAMSQGCFGKVTEETVGEEGVPTLVTYVLDPSGIHYLRQAALNHLVCEYPSETWVGGWEGQESGCTVDPDPVGGPADTPCWWEYAITPDRTAPGYLPGAGVTREDMLSAAVFIGAGADKTSPVTLDEIINVNNYLGVNLWTYTRNKKEQTLEIRYFPFSVNGIPQGWFKYARGEDACASPTYADLLTDAGYGTFVPASVDVFEGPPTQSTPALHGVDLDSIGITVCRNGLPLSSNGNGQVVCKASDDPAYDPSENGFKGCGGANWFAQAAEDARKTIWYLHNWRVPELAY